MGLVKFAGSLPMGSRSHPWVPTWGHGGNIPLLCRKLLPLPAAPNGCTAIKQPRKNDGREGKRATKEISSHPGKSQLSADRGLYPRKPRA